VAQNWQYNTGVHQFLFTNTSRLFELWKNPTKAQSLKPEDKVAVIVTLTAQVDLKKIRDKDKSKLRIKFVTELQDKDKISRKWKYIKEFLKQYNLKKLVSFWVFNDVGVNAAKDVICEMTNQPGVANIGLDDTLTLSDADPSMPDNDDGHGLIDVMQAIAYLDLYPPDQFIDADGDGKGGGKRNSN